MPKSDAPAEKLNLPDMVDQATDKISRLRKQQEILQKQKAELEGMNVKRQEFIRGQQEMKISLSQALSVLERESGELQKSLNLVESFRDKFRQSLQDVASIDEESWDAANISRELNDSLALVNQARMNYNEARGKIAALSCGVVKKEIVLDNPTPEPKLSLDTASLIRAGFFLFLPPFVLILIVIFVFWILERV